MGAKKRQPHRTYSKELKQILLSRMATEPYESLSREFGVSVKTMENWQYKYKIWRELIKMLLNNSS